MSGSEKIRAEALKLLRRCKTRNPFVIADEIGVHIRFRNDFVKLKGFYKVIERNRFIFINANLPEYEQRIICAHELGHDALHRTLAKYGILQEIMLLDMKHRPEYEANAFAAEILLSDDEVFELAESGFDEGQIARALRTDVNLLLIKMNEMNKRGAGFRLSNAPRGGFLGE